MINYHKLMRLKSKKKEWKMRKTKKPKKKMPQIQVSLEPSEIEKIDKIANKLTISRSALVRNLVRASLDDVAILNSVGLVDLVGAYRKMENSKEINKNVKKQLLIPA